MKTLFNFIKKFKDEPLTRKTFTEVDSLILSELVYLRFELYSPVYDKNKDLNSKLFSTIAQETNYDILASQTLLPRKNIKLIKMIRDSKRYANLKVNYFSDNLDFVRDVQFAAITFFINDVTYVCFRGTDTTISGWVENFNMALYAKVQSQKEALEYLQNVSKRIKGDFYVGGHSKGGNLAEFSSIFVEKSVQDRIINVYNHDGPGFYDDVRNKPEYLNIRERFRKTIPTDSVVGYLLNYTDDYKIIKSNNIRFFQHDPFSWGVKLKTRTFVYTKKRSQLTQVLAKTLIEFLNYMDEEQKKEFIESFFYIFKVNNINSFYYFKKNLIQKLNNLRKSYKELDPEKKIKLKNSFKTLIKLYKKNLYYIKFKQDIYFDNYDYKFLTVEEMKLLKEHANDDDDISWNICF